MFRVGSRYGDVLVGTDDGQVTAIYFDDQADGISILSSITYPSHKMIEGWRISDLVPKHRFLILNPSLNGSIARFIQRTYNGYTIILPKEARALGLNTRRVPQPPIQISHTLSSGSDIPFHFGSSLYNPLNRLLDVVSQPTLEEDVKKSCRCTIISLACFVVIVVIFTVVYIDK